MLGENVSDGFLKQHTFTSLKITCKFGVVFPLDTTNGLIARFNSVQQM